MPQYATARDLGQLGLRRLATAGVPAEDIDAALLAASEVADGYLRAQYQLPLTDWGTDLRRHVAMIAAWDILSAQRGFNPDLPGDRVWLARYEQAIGWLRDVAGGLVTPNVTDSARAKARVGAPRVLTKEPRGW